MRKIPKLNRILSLGLAVALMVASPMSAYAENEDAPADYTTIISEEESSGDLDTADEPSVSGEDATDSDEDVTELPENPVDEELNNDDSNNTDSDISSDGDDEKKPEKAVADEAGKIASENEAEDADAEESDDKSDEEVDEESEEESDENEIEYSYVSNNDGTHTKSWTDEDGELHEEIEDCEYDENGVCTHCGYEEAIEYEYKYVSNNDGTHTKSWIDEDGELHEEIEDCEYNEDGVCKHCGYEKKEDQTFVVKVGAYTITAEVPAGAFDVDVTFEAEEVSLNSNEEQLVNDAIPYADIENYVAFDLRFMHDGEEIEPNEGYNIKISIESDSITADEVVHIKEDIQDKDNDEKKVAEVVEASPSDDKVDFELDSFSKAVLVDIPTNSILYNDTAYGSAYSKQVHVDGTADYNSQSYFTQENILNLYPVQIGYGVAENQDSYSFTPFAPAQSGSGTTKCYVYKNTDLRSDMYLDMTFVAPEDYYIDCVVHVRKNYENDRTDIFKIGNNNVTDVEYTGSYATKFSFSTWLVSSGGQAHYNFFKVVLKRIPTTLTKEYSYVDGATLVNYQNDTTVFSNDFKFGGSGMSPDSNVCHYTKVYQGLPSSTLTNAGDFTLAGGNNKEFFPDYGIYANNLDTYKDYITSYYNNARVKFYKDTDGYWTVDSSQYKYVAKDFYDNELGIIRQEIVDSNGEQFRPFGSDNHFGMMLPIPFSVNEQGKTNGKDTVFKFFGDDDVFVYVDGQLVLDLGGIHDKIYGQINFRTGDILIQGEYNGVLTSSTDGSVFQNKGIGTPNLYTDVLSKIGINNVSDLSKGDNHVITVVYFERGANLSNCRISYNFKKPETRTVEYEGLKVDEDYNGLAGAEFTLYTDENCTELAYMGVGIPAVATSDDDGTIKFVGLSAGIIEDNQNSITKTYYMKETKAPDGYDTPTNAKWKLVLTANKDGTSNSSLTALNDEAKNISIDGNRNAISDSSTNVEAIINRLTNVYKTISVTKIVEYNGIQEDKNLKFNFVIEKVETVDNVTTYTPVGNFPFKRGSENKKTDNSGVFTLKNGQTAVFENLPGTNYVIKEQDVKESTNNVYKLDDFNTKVVVDGDETNAITFSHDVNSERRVEVAFEKNGSTEKTITYTNSLIHKYDWKVIKKSETTKATLPDAEFDLINKDKTVYYYGKTDATGLITWYSSTVDRANGTNPVNVNDGKYTLTETKAPKGYALSDEEWNIVVNSYQGITVTSGNNNVTGVESLAGNVTTYEYSFFDTVAYTLPETGGRGTYVYTIGGVLLLMGAMLLLYKNKKHKNNN